jgi:hypothetical protein
MKSIWALQIEYRVGGDTVRRSHMVNETYDILMLEKHLKTFGARIVGKYVLPLCDWSEVIDDVEKEMETAL